MIIEKGDKESENNLICKSHKRPLSTNALTDHLLYTGNYKISYMTQLRRSCMKQVHFRIDDAQYKELKQAVKDEGVTIQSYLTTALGRYMSRHEEQEVDAKFSFVDLFAGIGGIRMAYESQGGYCVFSSEWDKYCQQTYYKNFYAMPHGDITKIDEEEIPDHDVLLAGFPCQPFSIAGVSKNRSLGRKTGFLEKTQGTLFFDIARIIKAKRPKAFMLENVKNLQSHNKGNTWKIIEETLVDLDYEIFTEVLNGKDFVPQNRERIFIVGYDKKRYGKNIEYKFDIIKPDNRMVLADILLPEVEDKYTLSDKLWSYLQEYAERHRRKGNGFGYGLPELDGISRTLSARYYKDGSEILIRQKGNNPRRLTPRECARLQGFPDDFIIPVSDTQAYKQFGNSVVVPLVAEVARNVTQTLAKLEKKNKSKPIQKVARK